MKNKIFIATSIDGYIAEKDGGLDWLQTVPNPKNDDMGFFDFMDSVDALVMGRTTFETVVGFDVEWPYDVPVFVLSNSMTEIPVSHQDKAFLAKGTLTEILDSIRSKGYNNLYIDGGSTIQNFLKEDLIDEMIISRIPVLLGGGASLFGDMPQQLDFELVETKTYLKQIVQLHYRKKEINHK